MLEPKELFLYWVKERLSIYYNKCDNLPKPWTKDPILQNYRFCNVHREHDTVTKWIDRHWREGTPDSSKLPLAMVVARTINWPDTLQEISYPYGNIPVWIEDARTKMKSRRARGEKVWTGAYLVSTNGVQMDKIDYIIDRVWLPFYENMRYPGREETLRSYWTYLRQFDGLGSFMAAQIVCDLKYTKALKDAPDWWQWCAAGPGSLRGVNRYLSRPIGQSVTEDLFVDTIHEAQGAVLYTLGVRLHAQDVQNCFCEYDKYVRVLNGEGKPRSKYAGTN